MRIVDKGLPILAQSEGPTDIPLLEETIGDRFSAIVGRFPHQAAIKSGARTVSYLELDGLADAFAGGLAHLGIQAGDRVAVSLGNLIEYAVILYACCKIGAILVPLNPSYLARQTISALNHISAKCYITSAETKRPHKKPQSTAHSLWEIVGNSGGDDHKPPAVPSLEKIVLVNISSRQVDVAQFPALVQYEDLINAHRERQSPTDGQFSPDDVVTIQFTSGTTSSPKAVVLTHRNILNNAMLVSQGMELTNEDAICCPPPLFHSFGIVLGLLTTMTCGSTILLPSETFDAGLTLQSIVDHHATVLYGVPTMFLMELDLISQGFVNTSALKRLRTGIIGASPIPPQLRLRLHAEMNLSGLVNCYGLTETSPIACMTRMTDSLGNKLASVSHGLPHTSVRICAHDDPWRTLRRGEKGEVQIRGYSVMKGYWGDEEATDRALLRTPPLDARGLSSEGGARAAQPWLRTGDEGVMEDDGTVKITGRIKDIIIRGGENLCPLDIENILLQHAHILDAAVVGLPDPLYGQVVAAYVVLRKGVGTHRAADEPPSTARPEQLQTAVVTEEGIRDWVRQRASRAMVPKTVFLTDALPLTASGKVAKEELRSLGVQRLQGMKPNRL